jgi:DNA replicative helicase MCM subunit Mcm2 (Cdc46/Mcm family)
MNEWDEERIYMRTSEAAETKLVNSNELNDTKALVEFKNFLTTFQVKDEYIYSDQIRTNYRLGKYFITVQLSDLYLSKPALADAVRSNPTHYIAIVC